MTVLGHWVLILALISTVASALLYFRAASGRAHPLSSARIFLVTSVLLVIAASVLLLTSLLRHDYSNGYIFSYSDRSLPLHFLISSFYAGQEGSFLFWVLCSGLIAIVLRKYAQKRQNEPWVMTIFMAVQAVLLLLVVVKSPFRTVWEMFPQAPAGQIPADGRGLNPLLQNFWMVIHPPVLFVGFAAMAAPFSLALAGLWKKEYDILVNQSFSWVLFAVTILGLGIMLGAYWAYGVLGWGGYWGWDPVENSSLVPWLTGVALLHTMLAQLRTSKYARTNFALAIISFFLVVYSTFLTRSGILGDASVHSFTDPGASVYWLLIAFLTLIAVSGAWLIALRFKEMRPEKTDTMLVTRETSLGAGTIMLLLSAVVILFGTSLPIFSKTRVEPAFYDSTNLPIAILMMLLIGFGLYTQWEFQDYRETLRRSWKALAGALLVALVLFFVGVRDTMGLLLISGSIFALLVNLDIGLKVLRGDPLYLGGKIAHIGIALFLIGVIATGKYGTTQRVALPMNSPTTAAGHTLTFVGESVTPDGKLGLHVRVATRDEKFDLTPLILESEQYGQLRNPDIASSLTRDFYISPVSLEPAAADPNSGLQTYAIEKGETVSIGNIKATFARFDMSKQSTEAMTSGGRGMVVGSVLELTDGTRSETVTPLAMYEANGAPVYRAVRSNLLDANIQLVAMHIGMGSGASTITIGVQQANDVELRPDTLVVDVSIKPYINLLWGGTLLLMIGLVLSIVKRSKEA